MQLIHEVKGWKKLNIRDVIQIIIRKNIKCGIQNINYKIQNVNYKI